MCDNNTACGSKTQSVAPYLDPKKDHMPLSKRFSVNLWSHCVNNPRFGKS